MRKPTLNICENKGADQLHRNCEADQPLCFCYMDSIIPLLSKSKLSSLKLSSLLVQLGLCNTCSETVLLFSRDAAKIYLTSSKTVILVEAQLNNTYT